MAVLITVYLDIIHVYLIHVLYVSLSDAVINPHSVWLLLIIIIIYRYGLIQTADQLQFSYMAILDGAHAILSNAQSEPEPVEDELEDPYRDDSPLDTDDDVDDVDDERAELEATSAEVNGDVVGLDQGEKTPMPPPVCVLLAIIVNSYVKY